MGDALVSGSDRIENDQADENGQESMEAANALPSQMKMGLFGKSAANLNTSGLSATLNESCGSLADTSILSKQSNQEQEEGQVADEKGEEASADVTATPTEKDASGMEGVTSPNEETAPESNGAAEGDQELVSPVECDKHEEEEEDLPPAAPSLNNDVSVSADEKPRAREMIYEDASDSDCSDEKSGDEEEEEDLPAKAVPAEQTGKEGSSSIEEVPEKTAVPSDAETTEHDGGDAVEQPASPEPADSSEKAIEGEKEEEGPQMAEQEDEKMDSSTVDDKEEKAAAEKDTSSSDDVVMAEEKESVNESEPIPSENDKTGEPDESTAIDMATEEESETEKTEEKKEDEDEKEEKEEEDEEKEVAKTPKTPALRKRGSSSARSTPRRGAASAKKAKEIEEKEQAEETSEDKEQKEEDDEQESSPVQPRVTRTSSRKSTAEVKTPVRATPTRAKATPTAAKATPTAAKATPTAAKATPIAAKATPTPAKATPTPAKATPTPAKATPTRGRRSMVAEEKMKTPAAAAKESTDSPRGRRSAARKDPPKSSKKQEVKEDEKEEDEEMEEVEEKAEEVPPQQSAKKTPKLKRVGGSLKSTPVSVKPPVPKKSVSQPSKGADPYDFDTEEEAHPEPLKNISMELQSFGDVRFARVGSGKYSHTEKTAEARVANLPDLATPRVKERRSLAELTPGRGKSMPAKVSRTEPAGRRGRGRVGGNKKKSKKDEEESEGEEEGEKMDTEEETTPKTKATPGRKRKAADSTASLSAKRRLQPEADLPQLDAEALWAVDHPEEEHSSLERGARVYAAFDKVYYAAVVLVSGKDNLARYKVRFLEDDIVKDVPAAGVIPLRAVAKDEPCIASVDGDMRDVVVVSAPNEDSKDDWKEGIFSVVETNEDGEKQGKEMRVEWSKLSLDMADWKAYIDKKSKEVTTVGSDNISTSTPGGRPSRRSQVQPQSAGGSKSAAKKGGQKRKSAGSKSSADTPAKAVGEEEEEKSEEKTTPKGRGKRGRPSAAAASAAGSRQPAPESPQAPASPPPTTPPPQLEPKPKEEEVYTQSANSDTDDDSALMSMFQGMIFLLTSAQRPQADGQTQFRKKVMSDFIRQCQGHVVDDFAEIDMYPERSAFLISDMHYRTHKYLSAMARGVPCVSHEWIHNCRDSSSLLDYKSYLLPAGVSILDQQTYPLPTSNKTLLSGKVVLVHTNNQPSGPRALNFVQIWQPMVGHLGGRAVTSMPPGDEPVDIMLTDPSASPELLEAARARGCVIVSSEWIIQGIIMSKLPPFDAHPRFKHDFQAPR